MDGDQSAFQALVLSYERPLLTFLYALLRDWESALDVAQDTFVAVYYALPRWKHPETNLLADETVQEMTPVSFKHINVALHPLAPWIYRIATNKALTFLKKKANHSRNISLEADILSLADHAMLFAESSSVIVAFEDRFATQDMLREALGYLPEEDAMCVVFRFALGEHYDEIAKKFI